MPDIDSLVHWGYEDYIGPAHWGDLCPAFAPCKEGRAQSPIDIPSSAPANPPDLGFDYRPSPVRIANTGHTIHVGYDAGSALYVDGLAYELLQYHFHNPSETTVDGVATPMELHLVHQSAAGDLAVVGVFLNQGARNPAYAHIFNYMPAKIGDRVHLTGLRVNAADLLPRDRSYWRWDGSLTTPPCTEGVKWFMLTTPVELSARQIESFKKLYTGNARPVQPMNGRAFLIGKQTE